ncbi:dash complex subunit ask1 like protein [Zymoseptoria brevis]|uniref:DASH complex subunit ASK1 n=1 Tax=Zymoseptoria brevis TaxID=1047168 RepID=A0A0F4GP73_9PEZI|nr:dash complex subunit ask1 like protein [Zymoseptoria brevis]
MSRSMAQRSLTLTEELEKLEQQITLTLQEIDSNFSKAHRIVTSSILPIVEEYAKHSGEVWEGSKFWKQFFEASANVSLSGYEEAQEEEVTHTETNESFQTPSDRDESTVTGAELDNANGEDDFSVDSPSQVTGVQSTPKLTPTGRRGSAGRSTRSARSAASSYKSPTPRKYTGRNQMGNDPESEQPSTPRMPSALNFQQSSPFEPESAYQPSAFNTRHNNDPLMHRVLDKNYRVQATPLTQRKQPEPNRKKATPATATKSAPWDDSPQSSPEISAPQLRSDFFSPAKTAPRTPGLSVLASARKPAGGGKAPTTSTGRQLFSPQDKTYASTRDRTYTFDDSDDEDDLPEMSPPKTMQFHVPQSRLMQTPAREASKRIVEDLLMTAGADNTDDIEGEDFELELEASPSVVKRAGDWDEDTF